jgi:hypothetical protein
VFDERNLIDLGNAKVLFRQNGRLYQNINGVLTDVTRRYNANPRPYNSEYAILDVKTGGRGDTFRLAQHDGKPFGEATVLAHVFKGYLDTNSGVGLRGVHGRRFVPEENFTGIIRDSAGNDFVLGRDAHGVLTGKLVAPTPAQVAAAGPNDIIVTPEPLGMPGSPITAQAGAVEALSNYFRDPVGSTIIVAHVPAHPPHAATNAYYVVEENKLKQLTPAQYAEQSPHKVKKVIDTTLPGNGHILGLFEDGHVIRSDPHAHEFLSPQQTREVNDFFTTVFGGNSRVPVRANPQFERYAATAKNERFLFFNEREGFDQAFVDQMKHVARPTATFEQAVNAAKVTLHPGDGGH